MTKLFQSLHKNELSLRDYSDVYLEDHSEISEILASASTSNQGCPPLRYTSNDLT